MPVELRIPEAGESISEVRVGAWRKSEGESVSVDEVVVEIETDKATMELPAPISGRIVEILAKEGAEAAVGEVIALMEAGEAPPPSHSPPDAPTLGGKTAKSRAMPRAAAPHVMPAARRVLGEAGLSARGIEGTGPGGRILKEDASLLVETMKPESLPAPQPAEAPPPRPVDTPSREEEPVPMTPMRRVMAQTLVAAQHNAALLTTFNEVDMSAVIALRKRYRDLYQKRHGVKLGFMSFFVKASVGALREVPAVNARIDGAHIVYRSYHDIGVAVGGRRGLVVPVLRNAERMSLADIDRTIADFAVRARRNRIELSELHGGTFTISNAGIYGSMLSTPMVNPPQSAILGMHAIQDRPVAVDGNVEIRPVMYLALTYDHRIIDGREAVTFLRRIKDLVESPERILLQV